MACSRRVTLRGLVRALLARERQELSRSSLAERRRIVVVAYDFPLAMLLLKTVLAVTPQERAEINREQARCDLAGWMDRDIPF